MKQRIFNTGVFAVIGFVAAFMAIIPSIAEAQSVTIGTIPSASFCTGDPISVSFTVTGFWQHKNAFTLQLSDATGSFLNNFTNLGSIKDTLPGTFTINAAIPTGIVSSTHYRFRIMGALPYTTSADNGSNIAIGQVPQATISIADTDVAVGHSVGIWASVSSLDTAFWDYGSGATVVGDSLRYSTGGEKTVTLRVVSPGGCSATDTATLRVFDCTSPAIPHSAFVISNDTTIYGWYLKTFWVNPGVTVTFLDGDDNTIFAESGSTINSGQIGDIYYLKQGALLNSYGYYDGIAVFATGASVGNSINSLNCPTLDFDYTNAPPNSVMPAGVSAPAAPVEITLVPNPTHGSIHVDGLPSNAREITIENVLGQRVGEWSNPGSQPLTLDLGNYSPGTYYLRFLSGATVVTKKIVLE